MTYRFCNLLGTGAVALVLGAAAVPALAQGLNAPDGRVACDAARRVPGGAWTIVRPVTISPNGTSISLSPGQTFTPGELIAPGVEPTAVFDRNCGNH